MTLRSFLPDASRLALLVALTLGCSESSTRGDGGPTGGDGGPVDAGALSDAASDAPALDAARDAGGSDAGTRRPVNHRADDSECAGSAPAGTCSFGAGAGDCSTDADCTAGVNGRCNMNLGGAAFCRCTYDVCAGDAECASGQTCACHGSTFHADGNECIGGNCRRDSDCGAGGFCSPTIGGCGGLSGYYCHTSEDLCTDDADCTSSGAPEACQYVATSARWECVARMFCP